MWKKILGIWVSNDGDQKGSQGQTEKAVVLQEEEGLYYLKMNAT
jgi:hypothetical protein